MGGGEGGANSFAQVAEEGCLTELFKRLLRFEKIIGSDL